MKRQAKLLIILVLSVVLNLVYSFEDDDDDDRLSGEFWKRNEKNNLASSLKYRGFSKGKGKRINNEYDDFDEYIFKRDGEDSEDEIFSRFNGKTMWKRDEENDSLGNDVSNQQKWKTYNEWRNFVDQSKIIPKTKAIKDSNQISKCSKMVCKSFISRLNGCRKYC